MSSSESPPKHSGDPSLSDTAAFPLRRRGDTPMEPASSYQVGPGALLAGKYRIVRVIGQGGMGVVMEARHTQLDIPVAMKLLSPEFAGSTEALGRFLREARAASRLSNHHVTRVIDVGTLDSGEPYMVMEYLSGEDLAQRAKAGPLEILEAVDYIAQACEAIAEAHASGIIHRDIKPANLFLTRTAGGAAHVKVLDFGVSKVMHEGGDDVRLTQTTTILGSALYMSPEQMRSSKHVDERTDIYALGACLFELIGGDPPYWAPSFPELCAKVFTSPPRPLSELRPGVPDGLVKVIEKALSREPDERYGSVADFAHALSPYADDPTRATIKTLLAEHEPDLELLPQVRMPRRREEERGPRRGAAWIAWSLGLLVVLGVGGTVAYRRGLLSGRRAGVAIEGSAKPVATAPPVASAGPTAAVSASAPPVVSASVTTTASASATPIASASAAPIASATPAASASAARGPKAANDTGKAVPPAPPRPQDTAPVVAPPVKAQDANISSDLTQTVCTQTMPDGTKKVVPCP